MKQIFQDLNSGEILMLDVPPPAVKAKSMLIKTNLSLVSTGTERMLLKFGKGNLVQKALSQPERVKDVITKVRVEGLLDTYSAVRSKLNQPIALGYCNVGVVAELSAVVQGFNVGDRVVSNGQHAGLVLGYPNLTALIPDNVEDEHASFSILGAIALQGIRLAKPTIGETFVVFGVGLVGNIACQILLANGCRVLAFDYDQNKLDIVSQMGAATHLVDDSSDTVALARSFSQGNDGVDGVIIAASTDSNALISDAARMCRKRGRVILVGVTGLNLNRNDFYENEISFQVSCSYGPGRYDSSYERSGNDYPLGFVRWTENRNIKTILELMSTGKIDVKPLISHRFDFDDASACYSTLLNDSASMGLILKYRDVKHRNTDSKVLLNKQALNLTKAPNLGFIGAGNYATRMLVPSFKKNHASLNAIVSEGGSSATLVGKKLGFKFAGSNTDLVFNNDEIDAIVVATRHDSHAELVIKALKAGKHVFVEKPLALSYSELDRIKSAYEQSSSILMVGYNRRFAPHVIKMKGLLDKITEPKSFIMTMNAGSLPDDNWAHDRKLGGGRILAEACHYIDLMRFLAGSPIENINAVALKNSTKYSKVDCVNISISFLDGSMGNISYLANGSKEFPKERIEVFSNGRTIQLDNFRKLNYFGWKKSDSFKSFKQDKGQNSCVAAFLNGIDSGCPPIPPEELFEVAERALDVAKILYQDQSSD